MSDLNLRLVLTLFNAKCYAQHLLLSQVTVLPGIMHHSRLELINVCYPSGVNKTRIPCARVYGTILLSEMVPFELAHSHGPQ